MASNNSLHEQADKPCRAMICSSQSVEPFTGQPFNSRYIEIDPSSNTLIRYEITTRQYDDIHMNTTTGLSYTHILLNDSFNNSS